MIFEIRMAWRETRPAFKRFVFMIMAIALGVGCLTGLKGFTQALDRSILRSARDLIAADMTARMNTLPTPDEIRLLESLVQRGAELTRTTETLSMTSPLETSDAILCEIRAVDPELYPFYGKVELEPPIAFRQALTDNDTLVSQSFLSRTGVSIGDRVQIGSAEFRITAVLKSEPDRIAFGFDVGPRILITRRGLERSGLIQFGSRASETFLYRLPSSGMSLEEAREIISVGIERRVRITDYRNPNPSVSRGLERGARFLSLIGLLALLVGGLGVSTTIHTYLRQKLDCIAVLKCLGGRSKQIMRIYLVQGLALGILGSTAGIGLGYLIQMLFPHLLKGLVDLPTNLELAPRAALQGFAVGILTTLLFLLPPLLAIRKIQPMRVFLREMPETKYSTLDRLRKDFLPLAASLLLLLGVGLAATWLAGSWRWGATFMAGLLGCILVLVFAARFLLTMLKRIPRISLLVLRQGLKNLNRPGNHVVSVLVALGLAVAFILTTYFIQTSLISQIVRSAPADFPNVFLLGVVERDKRGLLDLMNRQKGIQAQALIPALSSRLLRIDGKNADQLGLGNYERRYFQMEFSLTWNEALPPDTRILEGQWWRPPFDTPMISVGDNAAERLKIGIGSVLEFDISGELARGKVVNIRDAEFSRPGTSNQFIFSPGSLESFPASYVGTIRMDPAQVPGFQGALFRQFPNITSIDVGQVLTRIQDLLDKMSTVIRFIAFFAIISGIIILASSVVSTRYLRIREAALLKTLGATRSVVGLIQTVEFLIIGSAAGLIGGILAAVAAHYLLGNLLDTNFDFQWTPLVIGMLAAALLTSATGWLASRGVMNHKPLEILREN